MVRTDDNGSSFTKLQHFSMAEGPGGSRQIVFFPDRSHYNLERELSKTENRLQIPQRIYLAGEVLGTVVCLVDGGLVVGRSALDRGRNVRAFQHESIVQAL